MDKKWLFCMIFVFCLLTGCAAEDHIKKGAELLTAEKYEEAIGAFEKAIEQGDRVSDAYKGIGYAHYELGQYQQAVEAFETAIKKGADRTPLIYNLIGICDMHLGNYQSALNDFNLGLIAAENSEEEHAEVVREMRYNTIICYENVQNWAAAKSRIEEYILLYPDDQEAQREAQFLRTR